MNATFINRAAPEGVDFFLMYNVAKALLNDPQRGEVDISERIPRGTPVHSIKLLPNNAGYSFQVAGSDEVYATHSPNVFAVESPAHRVMHGAIGRLDQLIGALQEEKYTLMRGVQSLRELILDQWAAENPQAEKTEG